MPRRRKVLILRGGALGDFIVTLPALAALRHHWPEAELELVGNAVAAELAKNRGLLRAVHSQHEARWSTLFSAEPLPTEFRDWLGQFEVIVNYWPDPDGVLSRHFPIQSEQRFVSWPSQPTRAPAAAHYGDALRAFGITVTEPFYSLRQVEPPPRGAADTSAPSRVGLDASPIALHPGSGSPRKNWPAERWIELMTSLPDPVLLVVGEAENATWSTSRLAQSPLAPRLRDGSLRIAPNLGLEGLIAQLQSCRLFLGHDSGISHLAAAAGVPCVLLFGPTDPAMWAPPANQVTILRGGEDLNGISVARVRQALS